MCFVWKKACKLSSYCSLFILDIVGCESILADIKKTHKQMKSQAMPMTKINYLKVRGFTNVHLIIKTKNQLVPPYVTFIVRILSQHL